MNYKKAILRMLKDYGAYQAYIENFKVLERYGEYYNSDCTFDEFLEKLLKKRGDSINNVLYYFINDSFPWDKTKEGGEYWAGVLDKMDVIGRILEGKYITIDIPVIEEELKYSEIIKKILYSDSKKDV